MDQKFQGLSHDERYQLILFTLFLVFLIALFLTTGLLLIKYFPNLVNTMTLGNISLSPDLGVFLSLILFSAGLVFTLLAAVIQDTLEFSYSPVLVFGAIGLVGFLLSLFNAFRHGGFFHGTLLIGIFVVEGLLISWLGVKLIDWCDTLYGYSPFSLRKGLTSKQVSREMKEDSFIEGFLPKRR
jgi:uncharacterized protein YacL